MAADAVVSLALEQLYSILKEEVILVRGVKDEVQKLKTKLEKISVVLEDAERRGVQEQAVKNWLDQLEDASYDIDDMLDEWKTSMGKLEMKKKNEGTGVAHHPKVCPFLISFYLCCYYKHKALRLHCDIARKVRNANESLEEISRVKDQFGLVSSSSLVNLEDVSSQRDVGLKRHIMTTSSVDEREIIGRDEAKAELLHCLLESSHQPPILDHPLVISIVGIGGIGKTALAQIAFNNDEVKKKFDKRIWVCVSKPWDQYRVAKTILEDLEDSAPNLNELDSVFRRIGEVIKNKKVLLVLDDVWTDDPQYFKQLMDTLSFCSESCRILITTHSESIAKAIRTANGIHLNPLSDEGSWSLFNQIAFYKKRDEERNKFERIGRQIVGKCKGLPLAIKTLAGLLSTKQTEKEWQGILESELWEFDKVEHEVFRPLLLSYHDLRPILLRKCFLYCAIFSKDEVIRVDELIWKWMAQGYIKKGDESGSKEMEDIGKEYFEILAKLYFFQDFREDGCGNVISCKMHIIVHDLARYLTKNECIHVNTDSAKETIPLGVSFEKCRHLRITMEKGGHLPVSIVKMRKLRTVYVHSYIKSKDDGSGLFLESLSKLLSQATSLRALTLDMPCLDPVEVHRILNGIEKNTHLRLLELKLSSIELPEAWCELYNLQVFLSRGRIKTLPHGIGKLINLRHLIHPGVAYIPKGIEMLTGLRTIDPAIGSKETKLQYLRDCNHLTGYLRLANLGRVSDVDDAKRMQLKNKKKVTGLELDFWVEDQRKFEDDEVLIDALEPPSNLKTLTISNYGGKVIGPSWWLSSLKYIRKLKLGGCQYCEQLPPLGKLQYLEFLYFWDMKHVKKVGDEFLGLKVENIEDDDVPLFPILKTLEFKIFETWEEWNYEITRKDRIMPRLEKLVIDHCPKLKALPDHLNTRITNSELKLEVGDCPTLKESPRIEDNCPTLKESPRIKDTACVVEPIICNVM